MASDFPECMAHRAEYEALDGTLYGENGQICHRIAHHSGDCIFDRPPEFTPVRREARPLDVVVVVATEERY